MFTVKELQVLATTFYAKDYKLPSNEDLQKIVLGFLLKEEEKKLEKNLEKSIEKSIEKKRERENIRRGDTRYHQMTGLESIAQWFTHYDSIY
jgi:hypothetical protein